MRYISRKTIAGKTYFYLQYKNYSKNIGLFLPSDLQEKMMIFFGEIFEKEWVKIPSGIKENFPEEGLKNLETFHYFFLLLGHELFGEKRNKFFAAFFKNFTLHSARSAGEKITGKDIDDFLSKNIRSPKTKTDCQLIGFFSALRFALSCDMKWNMKSIRHIHHLLFSKTDPLIAGKWRREEGGIEPQNIPAALKNLFFWLKGQFKSKTYPPSIALQFYARFMDIRPFSDGNARVAKLLFNAILQKFTYPPLIFFNENDPQLEVGLKHAAENRFKQINGYYLMQARKTADILLK